MDCYLKAKDRYRYISAGFKRIAKQFKRYLRMLVTSSISQRDVCQLRYTTTTDSFAVVCQRLQVSSQPFERVDHPSENSALGARIRIAFFEEHEVLQRN